MCVQCLGEHRWLNHFQAERLREHIRRDHPVTGHDTDSAMDSGRPAKDDVELEVWLLGMPMLRLMLLSPLLHLRHLVLLSLGLLSRGRRLRGRTPAALPRRATRPLGRPAL